MIADLYFSGIVGAQPHWGGLREQEIELTLEKFDHEGEKR